MLANSQRMGIRLSEADLWGLGFDDFEDGMVYMSLEAYMHPLVINLFLRMVDAYGWWHNLFFHALRQNRTLIQISRKLGLLPFVVRLLRRDVSRNIREEVNIRTYRTPDYQLSTAQDYRPGFGGDQHHIWQASLGAAAVCFTTHPARREGPSPNYWTGSGTLPRVAQLDNVVIAIYRINTGPGLLISNQLAMSHAWLPRDRFDEVVENGGWVFARKGAGYLALRSQHPYHWQETPGEDKGREMVVPGKRNIWICELGREADDGAFEAFRTRIAAARLEFDRLRVAYHSPSQGLLEFGWRGPLRQEHQAVALDGYARYENAYSQASFPSNHIRVDHGGCWLVLDWEKAGRQASGLCSLRATT
jgi:hypothetical protein